MDLQTEFNLWLAQHEGYWASLSHGKDEVVLSIHSSNPRMPAGKIVAGSADACYLIAMHCPESLPWMLSFDMELRRGWACKAASMPATPAANVA